MEEKGAATRAAQGPTPYSQLTPGAQTIRSEAFGAQAAAIFGGPLPAAAYAQPTMAQAMDIARTPAPEPVINYAGFPTIDASWWNNIWSGFNPAGPTNLWGLSGGQNWWNKNPLQLATASIGGAVATAAPILLLIIMMLMQNKSRRRR